MRTLYFWSVVSLSAYFKQGTKVTMYKILVVFATVMALTYCEPTFNHGIFRRKSHTSSYTYPKTIKSSYTSSYTHPETSRSPSYHSKPSVTRTVVKKVQSHSRRPYYKRKIPPRPLYYSDFPEYYQSAKPNHESTTPKTFSFQIFELPEPTEAPEFAPEPAPAVDPVAPKTPPTPNKDLSSFDLRANGFDVPPGVDLSSLNLDSYDDVDLESLQDYG